MLLSGEKLKMLLYNVKNIIPISPSLSYQRLNVKRIILQDILDEKNVTHNQ